MLRQCPFDPVHVVQAYRYQRHILRCRKQNPEKAVDFRQCKFNAMHFFHKDKILQHEEECVDKARIERNRKIAAGKEFWKTLSINQSIFRTMHEIGNR